MAHKISKFMHSECTDFARFRLSVTPEGKFVFDFMYRQTLVLSDGKEYDGITECVQSCCEMITKLDNHEMVDAIVQ